MGKEEEGEHSGVMARQRLAGGKGDCFRHRIVAGERRRRRGKWGEEWWGGDVDGGGEGRGAVESYGGPRSWFGEMAGRREGGGRSCELLVVLPGYRQLERGAKGFQPRLVQIA